MVNWAFFWPNPKALIPTQFTVDFYLTKKRLVQKIQDLFLIRPESKTSLSQTHKLWAITKPLSQFYVLIGPKPSLELPDEFTVFITIFDNPYVR